MTVDTILFVFTGGSGGRRDSPIWQANLFLLPGPDKKILPSTSELIELAKHGLGECEIEAHSLLCNLLFTLFTLSTVKPYYAKTLMQRLSNCFLQKNME